MVAAYAQVLAALRNCALGLLRQDGITNLAARLHAWQPIHVVLRLPGISLSGSLNHPG
ncbi:MAG: hypothetical protein PVSMB4_13760 [Ktedonobacterales bacterium]